MFVVKTPVLAEQSRFVYFHIKYLIFIKSFFLWHPPAPTGIQNGSLFF